MSFIDYILEFFKLVISGFKNFFQFTLDVPMYILYLKELLPFPLSYIATFFISIFTFYFYVKLLVAFMTIIGPVIDFFVDKISSVIGSLGGSGGK